MRSDIEDPRPDSDEKKGLVNGDDEKCDDNINQQKNCCLRQYESFKRIPRWARCLLLLLIILAYYILTLEYTVYAYDKKNTTENTITENTITAKIYHHSGFSKKTCEDFTNGCCEIYYNCKVITGNYPHIDYLSMPLSVYRIVAHDSIKSNCPSLRFMINKYNQKYGSDDCGEFGCCKDFNNLKCDDTIHINAIKNGNNQKLVDDFNNNTNTNIKIKVPKIDTQGSNCWDYSIYNSGINHFINKYENGYPDPEEPCDTICEIINVFMICGVLLCFATVMQ